MEKGKIQVPIIAFSFRNCNQNQKEQRGLALIGDVSYNQYETGPKRKMQLQVAERQIEVGGKIAAQAVCS